jgi:hypothetical protein
MVRELVPFDIRMGIQVSIIVVGRIKLRHIQHDVPRSSVLPAATSYIIGNADFDGPPGERALMMKV